MNELLRISFGKMGYDYDFLTEINKPAYAPGHLFLGEAEICLGLKGVRERRERIVVMPDFDMDGVSAGAVLYGGLSLFGFKAALYEPDPSKGYGIRKEDIDAVLEQWPDTKAVITCDVGAAAEFAMAYAAARGLSAYVTDHHIEKRGHRVDACAVMDPYRYDETCAFKDVCGAWVAWHLVMTYAKVAGGPAQQELCRKLVLFAGLGTCGDLMPVVHESRAAVTESVAEFNRLMGAGSLGDYFGCDEAMLPEAYAAPFAAMRALQGYLVDSGRLNTETVTDEAYSFTYCPMFNSVRRMGERMRPVYDLLFKRYAANSLERLSLCRWLCDLNDLRKQTVARLYGELKDDPRQALAPYVYLIDAAPGILGLLAAKLMDRNGRPCLVLRPDADKDGFSGSGRVPEWMDPSGLLDVDGATHDGHDRAFGAFVRSRSLQAVYRQMDARFLSESARAAAGPAEEDRRTVVCIGGHAACGGYDFSVTSPGDCDTCMDYAMEAAKFRPFGRGFREPEFVLSFLGSDVVGYRAMGSDRSHARIDFPHGMQAVWFGGAGFLDELSRGGPDDVHRLSGTFGVNVFGGSVSLQFRVSGKA